MREPQSSASSGAPTLANNKPYLTCKGNWVTKTQATSGVSIQINSKYHLSKFQLDPVSQTNFLVGHVYNSHHAFYVYRPRGGLAQQPSSSQASGASRPVEGFVPLPKPDRAEDREALQNEIRRGRYSLWMSWTIENNGQVIPVFKVTEPSQHPQVQGVSGFVDHQCRALSKSVFPQMH